MRIIKKSALLILLALLINIIFTDVLVYALTTVNNGEKITVGAGTRVGFNATTGPSGTQKQKNPSSQSSSSQTNIKRSQEKQQKPGTSNWKYTPDYTLRKSTPGYSYVEYYITSSSGSVNHGLSAGTRIKNTSGKTIGTVTPGGRILLTDGGNSSSKSKKDVITTKTTVKKGSTYTKKVKTVRYDWTIKNITDSSIKPDTRTTTGPTLPYTFKYTGTYRIEAVPYCYYEQGYDETTIITKYKNGVPQGSTSTTKFVVTKKYHAYDEKNKSVFTVIVTADDIDKEVVIPPSVPKTVKAIDELVE